MHWKSWLTCGLLVLGSACNRSGRSSSESTLDARSTDAKATPASAAPVPPAPASAAASEVALLGVGAEIPDVSATAQDGEVIRLRELQGKPVIVYFYPKDDTTGCTIEAKGIRDQYAELNSRAVVLGVSSDTQDAHKAFADKYSLPFKLLVDSSHTVAGAFGVPVSSRGYAKRVTFVIDKSGKVSKVFPNVNPDGHAKELLDALKALG